MSYLARLIAMKVETLPEFEEAKLWSHFRMSGGPMTASQHARHAELCGLESADHLLTLRARTTLGWYAVSWFKWFRYWDVDLYEDLGRLC